MSPLGFKASFDHQTRDDDDDDTNNDDYIAALLKRDAQRHLNADKYPFLVDPLDGPSSRLGARRRADHLPRPNTRFLQNILRDTDHFNAGLRAKEEAESQSRLDSLERPLKREHAQVLGKRRRDEGGKKSGKDHERAGDMVERGDDQKRGDHEKRDKKNQRDERKGRWGMALAGLGQRDAGRTLKEQEVGAERLPRSHLDQGQEQGRRTERKRGEKHKRGRHEVSQAGEKRRDKERRDTRRRGECISPRPSDATRSGKTSLEGIRRHTSDHDGHDSHNKHDNGTSRGHVYGPLPPSSSSHPNSPSHRGRGRRSSTSTSNINRHFAADYDPRKDPSADDDSFSDDDDDPLNRGTIHETNFHSSSSSLHCQASYRNRHAKNSISLIGADRLKRVGFSEAQISKWQAQDRGLLREHNQIATTNSVRRDTRDADIDAVKWNSRDQIRDWDRGKTIAASGVTDLRASWVAASKDE